LEKENPARAAVVISTLVTVTTAVPKRRMTRSLKTLETTVLPAVSMETMPA